MVECAVKFSKKYSASSLREIRFTNFDMETVGIFREEFGNRFENSPDSDEGGDTEEDEDKSGTK